MATQMPRYKDDLPNAFNGSVDPTKDFLSRMPAEIADTILSFLILDHDPERGVKKAAGEPEHTHVLISLAAMSRQWYHFIESFSVHFLKKHKVALCHTPSEDIEAGRKQRETSLRRSSRLVRKAPAPSDEYVAEVSRKQLVEHLKGRCALCFSRNCREGNFANTVSLCLDCDHSTFGLSITLTDALKRYDLRDYMLLKSRKPGPKAKHLDLPRVMYASKRAALGFPVFRTTTIYLLKLEDVKRLADLIHGDVRTHMEKKKTQQDARALKARCKRILVAKLNYHQDRKEVTTGKTAKFHHRELDRLMELPPGEEDDDQCACGAYHSREKFGLCYSCGDVSGRKGDCLYCFDEWMELQWDKLEERGL